MDGLNFIYAPEHKVAGNFRCKVPLKDSRQIFVIDGDVQGTSAPLSLTFAKGNVETETIQAINVRTAAHPDALSYETSFLFKENSSAKLILCSHTFAENPFLTDEKITIKMERGSRVDIVIMQNEHNYAEHNSKFEIEMAEDTYFKAVILTLHGGKIRNDISISLNGRGAECDVSGLYLVDGEQRVENNLKVEHRVPDCTSREMFKGILDDKAVAMFDGLIHVFPDAQRTAAFQECHNLLLKGTAKAYAQPQLEIYADDVKCSHGATNGRLNEDELFYLRSRGIPLKEANVLQQLAFAYTVLDHIDSDELRDRMVSLTERRLRGEFSDCHACCKNCC